MVVYVMGTLKLFINLIDMAGVHDITKYNSFQTHLN